MPAITIDISDLSKHEDAAKTLLDFAGDETVFLFDAPMGSGKTTFIKSMCRSLGVVDTMSSPTYSIVNEYKARDGKMIYHFDLYRLKHVNELYDLGFEEYLASGAYVFIEWPEMGQPFFNNFARVKIAMQDNNRYIYAEKFSDHA